MLCFIIHSFLASRIFNGQCVRPNRNNTFTNVPQTLIYFFFYFLDKMVSLVSTRHQ